MVTKWPQQWFARLDLGMSYTSFQAGPVWTGRGARSGWKAAENRRRLKYYILIFLSSVLRQGLGRLLVPPKVGRRELRGSLLGAAQANRRLWHARVSVHYQKLVGDARRQEHCLEQRLQQDRTHEPSTHCFNRIYVLMWLCLDLKAAWGIDRKLAQHWLNIS